MNLTSIQLYNMEHKPCDTYTLMNQYKGIHI